MSTSELESQINRFKVNEERVNTFVNVDGFYTTSSGVQVPTLLNVSKRIEASVENVSLAEQSASIEITRQTDLVIAASTSAQAEFLNEDSKINTLAKNTIADWQTAITTITQTEGVPALAVSTANNEDQQSINDSVGAKWYAKGGGYPINYRAMLDNGDIVKSTINGNTYNPNVDMTGWVKPNSASQIFDASGKTQQEVNDLLLKGTVSTYIITPETHSDVSDVLNTIPANSTVILKNGNYTASGVNVEKDNYKIEMQDGVVLTLKAGLNGIFMRFGRRGPSSDYNADNLPQHNGTLDYWDESQYSPASESYPRYKNLGVSGGTIILDSSNGTGAGTGVDFYRCDNPLLETNVKWASKFAFGNGVRIHFCKNMISRYLNIDDNENSTFTILYYWSYGLRAGDWDIGAGQDTSMEFKHSVDGYVRTLKCRGSGGACKALNYGYGSINNTIDRLEARNGSVRLKASEEFDLTRGVVINDLDIENVGAEGLVISHVAGLRVGKFNIRAKLPIYFSAAPFYKFSSNQPVTPIQSTAEYAFDGNYRTSEVSGGITKYFEKRAYPSLQNSSFGKGTLIATAGANQIITANIPGGVADMMTSNGKLRRFEEGQIPVNGYQESWRTSFKYEYSAPSAIEGVDFGDMTLKAENNAAAITAMAIFSMPLIKCSGTLRTYADKKSLQWIWMFDSDITLQTNRFLTASAGFVVEMDSMVRSKLRGKWLANGRVFNFKGGSSLYYTDGYVGHELAGEIIRQSAPTATPPLYTNFTASTNTWKPLTLTGLKIYADNGTSLLGDTSIIRHFGSLPVGVSTANGAGYVCDQACVTDHNQPFRRGFTDASAETPPPLTPNFVGELALNTTTNTWWKANSTSTWSKL